MIIKIISILFLITSFSAVKAQTFKRKNKIPSDTSEIFFEQKAQKFGEYSSWYHSDTTILWGASFHNEFKDEPFQLFFGVGWVAGPISVRSIGASAVLDGEYTKNNHLGSFRLDYKMAFLSSINISYAYRFIDFSYDRTRGMKFKRAIQSVYVKNYPIKQNVSIGVLGGYEYFLFSEKYQNGYTFNAPKIGLQFRTRHDVHVVLGTRQKYYVVEIPKEPIVEDIGLGDNWGGSMDTTYINPFNKNQPDTSKAPTADEIAKEKLELKEAQKAKLKANSYPPSDHDSKMQRHGRQSVLELSIYPDLLYGGVFALSGKYRLEFYPSYDIEKGYNNRRWVFEASLTKYKGIGGVSTQLLFGFGF